MMTDLKLKNIKRLIAVTAITVFFLLLFPIYYYMKTFEESGISNNISDWGSFGDYLSGTSGLILSFFAVIFSLISIVITAIIAKAVQDTNIQVVKTQVKPFLNIELIRLSDKTSVILKNMGLGPMVITKIELTYNGRRFLNFRHVIDQIHNELNIHDTEIRYNTVPDPILSPNSSLVLLEILPRQDNNDGFRQTQQLCRDLIGSYTINIEFQDIFTTEFKNSKVLTFLMN